MTIDVSIKLLVGLQFTPDDVHLSYLPLAHIFDYNCSLSIFPEAGARIGFGRGDPALLLEDLQCLKPTWLASVPRLLNRITAMLQVNTILGLLQYLILGCTYLPKHRLGSIMLRLPKSTSGNGD